MYFGIGRYRTEFGLGHWSEALLSFWIAGLVMVRCSWSLSSRVQHLGSMYTSLAIDQCKSSMIHAPAGGDSQLSQLWTGQGADQVAAALHRYKIRVLGCCCCAAQTILPTATHQALLR